MDSNLVNKELDNRNNINEIFVSKKSEHSGISRELQKVLETNLEIKGINGIKIFNNYLIEGLSPEQFEKSKRTVFSEAPVDDIIEGKEFEKFVNGKRLIVLESKPGQYDNRVDAIEQNLMLQTGAKHNSRFKKVVVVDGNISDEDYEKIVKFLKNPVETQSSSLYYDKSFNRKITNPINHRILKGFTKLTTDEELKSFIKKNEFSINLDDVKIILEYFRDEEKRNPTMVELLLIDTYWSDHCRHTTFETKIDKIDVSGEKGLVKEFKKFDKFFKNKSKKLGKEGNTFMELAKASFKFLKDDPKFKGKDFIDYSVEDNAASYKTTVELENGEKEEWIIMFKNETHNSPSEVEPFGGAATCLGGANVSSQESGGVSSEKAGSHVQKGNPVEERKFQRLQLNSEFTKLIKKSNDFGAGGLSVAIGELSRGIDIDLDIVEKYSKYEGLSDEELAIAESQERMSFVIDPKDYDKVMEMLEAENLEAYKIAEVSDNENKDEDRLVMNYKGKKSVNLSRNFLDKNGAERRANAKINLNKVEYFDKLDEKIQALLDEGKIKEAFIEQLKKLENASQKGLGSGFDNSVGASTILAPFGGKYQSSPQIGMASKIATFDGVDSLTAIISTNGFNPLLLSENTYIGGIFSIIEAVSKIVAMGGDYKKTWISLQEYFGKLTTDEKYGDVYAGLLGILKALTELKIVAIGGKDSMSGTAEIEGEKINVPNTIVTFANTPVNSDRIVSAEFKKSGNKILCFHIEKDENGLPIWNSYIKNINRITQLIKEGKVFSSSIVEHGGLVTSIAKLTLGNKIGFNFNNINESAFKLSIGDIVIEVLPEIAENEFSEYIIGTTTNDSKISFLDDSIDIDHAQAVLEGTLEDVWPTKKENSGKVVSIEEYKKRKTLEILSKLDTLEMESIENINRKPVALIPVFPGTNSELDTKHALLKAGFEVKEFVFYTPKTNNDKAHDKIEFEKFRQSRLKFAKLFKNTDFLIFPGGFSGGDEPDGSAKFIANIMKSEEIDEPFQQFLDRENTLTLGICNGFQALIKLGLFKNSKVKPELEASDPTLTYNDSLRHETDLVRLKVISILSPFLAEVNAGDEFVCPISHGEGKLVISEEEYREYLENGQIPFQYLDEDSNVTNKYNGSYNGVAGLTSPNGRILGMMPHIERNGKNVFKNIPGEKLIPMFKSAFNSLMGLRKNGSQNKKVA